MGVGVGSTPGEEVGVGSISGVWVGRGEELGEGLGSIPGITGPEGVVGLGVGVGVGVGTGAGSSPTLGTLVTSQIELPLMTVGR